MQKLLEVAQFKAIRGNLILVIIASYTLILELVNRSPSLLPVDVKTYIDYPMSLPNANIIFRFCNKERSI